MDRTSFFANRLTNYVIRTTVCVCVRSDDKLCNVRKYDVIVAYTYTIVVDVQSSRHRDSRGCEWAIGPPQTAQANLFWNNNKTE